jgi:hypothetical protein
MNWCYAFSRCWFIWCPPRHLAVEDRLTQLLRRYTPTVRRFIRCWRPLDQRFPFTKASINLVLKTSSWRISVLIQIECRIDRQRPLSDRQIIWCYCLRCSSSAIHPAHLETGPSVHPTVPGFHPVYQLIRPLHRRLLFRYRRFIRRCPFFSFSFSFFTLEE